MRITGLLAIATLCSSDPAPKDSPFVEQFTVEQIADGMEKTWTAISNRRVRWIRTPMSVTEEEASPDHPERLEYETIVAANGSYFETLNSYRGGVRPETHVDAWKSPFPPKPGRFYRSSNFDTWQLRVAVERGWLADDQRLVFQRMRDEKTKIIGETEVAGDRCIRVQIDWERDPDEMVTTPMERMVRLDIDPEKGFWPRRTISGDSNGCFEVIEMAQVDGIWYPKIARETSHEYYSYVQEVEFKEHPESTFEYKRPQRGAKESKKRGRSLLQRFGTGPILLSLYVAAAGGVLLILRVLRRLRARHGTRQSEPNGSNENGT